MQDDPDVAHGQGGGDGAVAAPPTTDARSGPAGERHIPGKEAGSDLGSRSTWILVVCCVAQFMVILDLSIVNVALPSIPTTTSPTSTGPPGSY